MLVERKDMESRIAGTFNREYDNKTKNGKNLTSIDDVCDGLFTKDYTIWKGKGLNKFEHIMKHLETSQQIKTLTFLKFVDVLTKCGFGYTVEQIGDCINEQSTSDE